ncbi:hypothetical protein [Kitasatospora sp. NPDC058478]|uniref:hypothetical protein n=1 Tax=unclassified Kitasatospora TaxID=2633591 RepID=UPI00365CA691
MGFQLNIETTGDSASIESPWYNTSNLGMAAIRSTMHGLGMLTRPTPPNLPPLSTFDLTISDIIGPGQVVPGKEANLAAAQAALEAMRAATEEPAVRGIPHYKLNSNLEHWLVTPVEITAALVAYDVRPALERRDLEACSADWRRWIPFLRMAAQHRGIRVY